MKKILFMVVFVLPTLLFSQKIIKLPLTYNDSYGIFNPSYTALSAGIDTMKTNALPIKGIPKNWKNIKKRIITTDFNQYIYQQFLSKEISKETYKEYAAELNKRKLVAKTTKCFVYLVIGELPDGQKMIVVDANNNSDVSDETPVALLPNEDYSGAKNEANQVITKISYDRIIDGKAIPASTFLILFTVGKRILYNFKHSATTEIIINNKTVKLGVNSGFTNIGNAGYTFIALDTLKSGKIKPEWQINEQEYIVIEGTVFKYLGIDDAENVLKLKQMKEKQSEIVAMQIGFKLPDFSETAFISGKKINLEDFKGKYVYLDFWGTWCSPCVQEIPHLKALYEKLDLSKIAFIGIARDEKPALEKFLNKENLKWDQILVGDDKLIEKYNVKGFPTTFLIDPNGKIIAKNLRAKALEDTLNELLKK